MRWCASAKHTLKIPEYSKSPSVLVTVTESWKLRRFLCCKFQYFFFIWGSRKFPRFLSFRFWPLYWNWKLGKLENIFKDYINFKKCALLEDAGNFWGFCVFSFGPYTEIENLEIFSRLVNFKKCALFEDAGNFWGFCVFDFGPYTEIENSENWEIFSRLVNKTCKCQSICFFWGSRKF